VTTTNEARIDLPEARLYLDALGGPDARFTFQTFDDDAGRKSRSLARVFHGRLDEHAGALARLNAGGAGVFVTVNETDLRGRKAANVVAGRALFIDKDEGPLPPFTIEPDLLVGRAEAPHKLHAYWLLRGGEPLDKFTAAQKALAGYFGSDPGVCDLPRVMRLPGFMHRKLGPQAVRLLRCEPSSPARTIEGIVAAHGGWPTAREASRQPNARADPADRDATMGGRLLRGALDRVKGGEKRNPAGFWLALQLRDGGFGEEAQEAIMRQYAAKVPKGDHPYTPDEALASLRSARSRPRRDATPHRGMDRRGDANPDDPERGSQLWFAERFRKRFGDDVRHDPGFGWSAWDADAGIWRRDEKAVTRLAHALSAELVEEARRELDEAETTRDGGKIQIAKRFFGACEQFRNWQPRKLALSDAAALDGIACEAAIWDARAFLLNVANGTVDLRDGKLRPHRREDYLTKRCAVAYRPGATGERWLRFLERILPDADVRDYLQRAIGYAATGCARENLLHFLVGLGANGKSVFCETAAYVLGDYAGAVADTVLFATRGQERPEFVATLHGLRLGLVNETREGAKLNEERVKALTGGDTITAKRLYHDPFTFEPTHALFVRTNHLPRTKGIDDGLRRRLRYIRFPVKIASPDPTLKDTLREPSEAEGALAWFVEGARLYHEDGTLRPPVAVMEETEASFAEGNDVAAFLRDCIREEPCGFESSADIHKHYVAWFATVAEGEVPRAQRSLTTSLKSAGLAHTHHPARGFKGVRLA